MVLRASKAQKLAGPLVEVGIYPFRGVDFDRDAPADRRRQQKVRPCAWPNAATQSYSRIVDASSPHLTQSLLPVSSVHSCLSFTPLAFRLNLSTFSLNTTASLIFTSSLPLQQSITNPCIHTATPRIYVTTRHVQIT